MTYLLSKHLPVLFLFFLLIFHPLTAAASEPPRPISPSDNSITEKSPKLIWEYVGECTESGSCFMVEVDEGSDFSSKVKSAYTNSLSYSPQGLEENIWYWRVKAKDKSGKWSAWSPAYKFTLASQIPSPSVSVPNKNIQPSPSAESPKKSENIFEISNIPAEINSNEEFETQVLFKISEKPDTSFFIKGAFKKDGSSNYFGVTKSEGDWIKNNAKYLKQLKVTTGTDGVWKGKIQIKPDDSDSGFEGSGNYIFKLARYSDSGSGPSWSNEVKIIIHSAPEPSVNPEEAEDTEEEIDDIKISTSSSNTKLLSKDFDIKIASVAGIETKSDNITPEEYTRVLSERKANWFLILSGFLVLLFGIGFVVFKIKKGKKDAGS